MTEKTNEPDSVDTSKTEVRRAPLTWKGKIGLILFGTVLALVILEVLLRSMGFVYYFEKRNTPGEYADEDFVVLCVGDSATFGQGVAGHPNRQSYPAQLEWILRQRHPEFEGEFHVVNMGLPGMNSSQLARRFEGYVQLHHPDLAIVLIGNNDVWNQNETFAYIVGKGEEAEIDERVETWLRSWSDSIRVIRLARVIAVNLDDDRDEMFDAKAEGQRHDDHFNAMEDVWPGSDHFEEGLDILGEVEHVQDLYRFNFKRIRKVAEEYDVDLLWLDYHLGAKFGETKYIEPVLEEMNANSLDLFPLFHTQDIEKDVNRWDETVRKDLICSDQWHPNERGYAVFARAVYNKLVELDYVPGPPMDIWEDLHVHDGTRTDLEASGPAPAVEEKG